MSGIGEYKMGEKGGRRGSGRGRKGRGREKKFEEEQRKRLFLLLKRNEEVGK